MPERSAEANPPRWPQTRGQCFIELMIRDPDWAVAYWEITPEAFEHGLNTLSTFSAKTRLSVRLYNLPKLADADPEVDAEAFVEAFGVDQWLGHRYLMLGRPNTFHAVAVGMSTDTGVFHPFARSRWVRAPRDLPAVGETPSFVRSTWAVDAKQSASIEVIAADAQGGVGS